MVVQRHRERRQPIIQREMMPCSAYADGAICPRRFLVAGQTASKDRRGDALVPPDSGPLTLLGRADCCLWSCVLNDRNPNCSAIWGSLATAGREGNGMSRGQSGEPQAGQLNGQGVNLALATWTFAINFWAWNLIGPLSATYTKAMSLSSPPDRVGAVTGIVGAAGGLGGFFPPLVMGATYNSADNNYTTGLALLSLVSVLALLYTAWRLPGRSRAPAKSPITT